jgi:hypothetical protein
LASREVLILVVKSGPTGTSLKRSDSPEEQRL